MKELLTQISRHIQSHGHKSNVVEEQQQTVRPVGKNERTKHEYAEPAI